MKARLTKLESIVQGYVSKDSVSAENYRYLQENIETVLYAIQEASKVEEMQKTLTEIANFDVAENYGLDTHQNEATSFITCRNLARQALKGETQ